MALAKVTASKYDYGAYARPTPVRVNPAMYSGLALLGQGLVQGINSIVLGKEKIKLEQETKDLESVKNTAEYKAKIKIINRKFGKQNEEYWRNKVLEFETNEKNKGTSKEELQTYYDTKIGLEDTIQQALQFKKHGMKLTERGEIPSNYISSASMENYLNSEALLNDQYTFSDDENGDMMVNVTKFNMKAMYEGKLIGGIRGLSPNAFITKSISIEDLPKHTELKLKYNKETDAKYASIIRTVTDSFKKNHHEYGISKYFDTNNNIVSPNGKIILKDILNNSESDEYKVIDQIIFEDGKEIFEDELGYGSGNYDNSNQEHKNKVRIWLNKELINKIEDVSLKVGVNRGDSKLTEAQIKRQIQLQNLEIARHTFLGVLKGNRSNAFIGLETASGKEILTETQNNDGTITLKYATGAVRYRDLVEGERGYDPNQTKKVPHQPSATVTYSFSKEEDIDKLFMILTDHPDMQSILKTEIEGSSDIVRSMASLVNKPGLWDSNFNTPTPKGWKELQESGLLSKITKERRKVDPSQEFSVEDDEPIMEEYLDYRDLTGLEKKHIAEYLERFTKK